MRCFYLIILFFTAPVHAIVSMESVHLGEPKEGLGGSLDISASGEYGNTEKASLSAGVKLQRYKNDNLDFMLLNHQYGESSGERDKNKSFIHGRHIHKITDKYAWEGYAQLSSDEFTRLNLRALLGAGARIAFGKKSEKRAFFLGLGGFYEKEELDLDEQGNEVSETVRASTYLVLKFQFNNNVSLVSSTYYQLDVTDFSNFRAVEDASLVSKLTDALSFKLSLNVAHDSEPPPDVERTDTSVNFGFLLDF